MFEIIMSNQCNRRCPYCKLDFHNKIISQEYLDSMVYFLESNKSSISNCIINFFGWEPLLNFDWIKYFVSKTKHLPFIKYSIWTNWILLNEKIFNYLNENNFQIYLSIDTEIADVILKKDFLKNNLKNIKLNFIVNPNTVDKSFLLFDKCIDFGFKNINIMPVMFSIKWNKNSFSLLKKFIDTKIKPFKNYDINLVSYYNWFTTDIQYVLDSDGFVYLDLDSLLWIQKQWSILSSKLKDKIHNYTKIWKMQDISFKKLISSYNIKEILKLVLEIPKYQWFLKDYKVISKIFNG